MKPPHRTFILIFAAVTTAVLTTIVTLRGQGQAGQKGALLDNRQQKEEFESQFPVTDFDSQEPAGIDERNLRRRKSSRYDNNHLVNKGDASSDATESVFFDERDSALPAAPSSQSDVILVGNVADARAYVSNDKTGVYSEFNVTIEETLKNRSSMPLVVNSAVSLEREGGAVRYPSKGKYLYRISGQGMPRVGRRYVFFLKATDPQQNFRIITAYELRGSNIYPLDYTEQIDEYKDADADKFLNAQNNAIAHPETELN